MSNITQNPESVSSLDVPFSTSRQQNQSNFPTLPVVCLACSVEEHRELPQVCTMQPCPKHVHSQHTSIDALAHKAFVAHLEQVCTKLVNLRAPAYIINPLRTASSVELLTIALSAAEFWLSPRHISLRRIEVQR